MEGFRPCPDCQALVEAELLDLEGCPFCAGAVAISVEDAPDGSVPSLRSAVVLAVALALMVPAAAAGLFATLDLDRDGLSSLEEWRIGSALSLADSDRDGLGDGWEVLHGLSPLRTDSDGDGVPDQDEIRAGTDPTSTDSDGDGVPDGEERERGLDARSSDTDGDRVSDAREIELGTDPTLPDTDGDLLWDDQELIEGSDPLATDSDQDGIPDGEEPLGVDCDGDGADAILDPDDDADGRIDGAEPPGQRCDPDVDGDGVLDGDEAHPDCIVRPDCDLDGLEDAIEHGDTRFDPLDPDSFGTGLTDGVVWAFEQAGQPPSADEDRDGIPDAWEETTGLLDWGPFTPQANRTDLLVEFVKVQGPDSGRYAPLLDFGPAYVRVAAAFEDAGVRVSFAETVVTLGTETRPPFLPSIEEPYYEEVLSRSAHGTNPYVNTVVLSPQHDQSGILHGGAAPIRGMLATVDYGVYTRLDYTFPNGTLTVRPFWESLIAGGQSDAIQALGFNEGGVTEDGRYGVRTDDYTLLWEPLWFATDPDIHWSDGSNATPTDFAAARYLQTQLAHVIMHEMGHNLGLCHTEDEACRAAFSPEDQAAYQETAMFSGRDDVLAFLGSEWQQVRQYLQCPPQQPVVLVAEGAGDAAVLDAKYRVTTATVLDADARVCQGLGSLVRAFERATATDPYETPRGILPAHTVWHDETRFVPAWAEPEWRANDPSNTRAFWGATGLLAALAASIPLLTMWGRRRPA